MKKTLIALAVLAASGASFAQATISGAIVAGYMASSTGSTATASPGDKSGLGFDDSAVKFAVSEDLGGGNKLTGELNMDGLKRDPSALGGRNAILAISTGAGTFELASKAHDNYTQVAGAGAGLLLGDSTNDTFTYSNKLGPVSFALMHRESNSGLGNGAAGLPASSAYQRNNSVTLGYAAGALSANLTYTAYDQKGTVGTNFDNQAVVGLGYDFGVAKVTFAAGQSKYVVGNSTDTALDLTVPLGALTLVGKLESRKTDDFATATDNGNRTSAQIAAGYALSKRTSLNLQYRKWDEVVGPKAAATRTFAYISHSF